MEDSMAEVVYEGSPQPLPNMIRFPRPQSTKICGLPHEGSKLTRLIRNFAFILLTGSSSLHANI